LSSHLFVKVSFSKFIKEFSTDPIKIITQMVNSVHSDLSYNQVIMNFFDQVYTTFAPREVTVLKASSGNQQFMMVFPYVHPGPLGELGSSNITGKLQRLHPGKSIMVFHTSTTHDDNCSSDDEIRKISKVLDEKGKDFTNSYEPFFGKYLTLIPLNEGGIFFISPDEPRFDDIKITEGMKIVKKAKSLGMKWAVIVDQHNNNMDRPEENKDVSYLMEEVELAVKSRKRQYPVYGSLAESYLTAKDIGPGGIKLLALEINKKKLAVILVDGNNMDYDLRLKIEEAITGYDKVLVCTTDNHIVNIDGLNVNPVGRSSEHEIIVNEIKRIAGQIVDMKELSFERIKKELRLKIAGEHHYDKLNETIRKSLNIAKISGIFAILFSLGLSLFIFKILT
jgi:putative membrane protein